MVFKKKKKRQLNTFKINKFKVPKKNKKIKFIFRK